jgi:hypothetical protein
MVTMASIGQHPRGQDSGIDLHAPVESSQQSQHGPLVAEAAAQEDEPLYDFASDSGFDSGSLVGDETDSLASNILNHRIENGRQYHAYRDGAYWGPNDEPAKEILDFAHHMYLLTLDQKLHLAPIQNPQQILDVGTGTGIWAIDMADQYPSAVVTGTDLSPIQPEWVPPNCHFEIDDVTLEWTFPDELFDFIHIRELFGCIPDWDFFFQQASTQNLVAGSRLWSIRCNRSQTTGPWGPTISTTPGARRSSRWAIDSAKLLLSGRKRRSEWSALASSTSSKSSTNGP